MTAPAPVRCADCDRPLRTAQSRRLGIGPVCLAANPGARAVLAATAIPRVASTPTTHGGLEVAAGQLTIEEAIGDEPDLH